MAPPPSAGAPAADRGGGAALSLRQFGALLRKNAALTARGRRGVLGAGGAWGGLALQVLLPALFFGVMWIPKHYIKPTHHPAFLEAQSYDLDTKWWAGPSPYEGPAFHARNNAKLILAPGTPAVRALAPLLAAALSCPNERYKRICSPDTINSFACLFGITAAPGQCADPAVCLSEPACAAPALSDHITVAESEAAALALAEAAPATYDALVVFGGGGGGGGDVGGAGFGGGGGGGGGGDGGGFGGFGGGGGGGGGGGAARAGGGGDGVASLLDYAICMNRTDVPPPQLLRDLFDVSPGTMPLPGNLLWEYRRYWFFVNLQLSIDRAILALVPHAAAAAAAADDDAAAADAGPGPAAPAGATRAAPGGAPPRRASLRAGGIANVTVPAAVTVRFKPFPWPPRSEDLGAASAAAALNLLLVYAFLAPTRAVVVDVVREKELRLREGMRMLGLTEAAYWASWGLTHWAALAVSGALCAAAGAYPFEHSDVTIMLAFYWLFGASLVAFGYALSALFSAARVAGTAVQLIYAASMVPGFLLPFTQPLGGPAWLWACALPTSAASLFASALLSWERVSQGVTWRTLWLPVTQDSPFSAGHVLLALALDVPLWAAATWYLDKVMPRTYGQRLPPWFPLDPAYWRGVHHGPPAAAGAQEAPQDGDYSGGSGSAAVAVAGLRKVFPSGGGGGGGVVALDGLSFSARRGAVAALLGRNGAGKTTAIHILTGMLQPSGGRAWVDGLDVSKEMAAVRRSLGVCPQFDVLWPQLTVGEHLATYWVLKGGGGGGRGGGGGAAAAAREAAAEVGLLDKLSTPASQLSGGQRRKLSVAIAFLRAPKVVILDEPTSGMDPVSRRATWDIIRARRASSSVLLTTHSMEEADALADDVTIIAAGRVVASGSPLELKARYGVGYTLTIVLSDGGASATSAAERGGEGGSGSARAVMGLVRRAVPGARLVSAAGGEVSAQLPREESAGFAQMLRDLEAAQRDLGVASYGLSVTTLEEVFLTLAEKGADEKEAEGAAAAAGLREPLLPRGGGGGGGSAGGGASSARLRGCPLYWQQLRALTIKRALCARRDRLALVTQLLVPLLLVWLALFVGSAPAARGGARGGGAAALLLSRGAALFGAPALLSASEGARGGGGGGGGALRAFVDAYPARDIEDSNATALYLGSSGAPLNATLEGSLLARWPSGRPRFDAVHFEALPSAEELASGGASWGYTLLLNQSAIAGLPAALAAANSAILRMTVLARASGGGSGGAGGAGGGGGASGGGGAAETGAGGGRAAGGAAGGPRRLLARAKRGAAGGAAAEDPLPTIRVSSQPLPLQRGEAALAVAEDAAALMLVLCVTLAGAVLTASFAVHLARERDSGFKHLQLLAGAPPSAFWAANYAADMVAFSLPAIGIVCLVALAGARLPSLQGSRLAALAGVLWAFGLAGLSATYMLHPLFSDEMRALQRLNSAYFLTGYLGFLATWVLDLIVRLLAPPGLAPAAAALRRGLAALSPHYNLARGLYDIHSSYKGGGPPLPIPGPQPPSSPFARATWGATLRHLAAQFVVYGAVAALSDAGLAEALRRARAALLRRGGGGGSSSGGEGAAAAAAEEGGADVAAGEEDADVAAERAAVEARLLLDGLRKSYPGGLGEPPVAAVAGLWLRVRPGECFGLLGANGAGKTTTFRIVTGEAAPDAGDAFVAGASVLLSRGAARRALGYCPQFDGLPGAMTGAEVLALYARLRGIPEHAVASETAPLLARLGLGGLAGRPAGGYSGGNRRRLSVGAALVGGPPVVLLDEPSTGLDPSARRALWNVIRDEVGAGPAAAAAAADGAAAGGAAAGAGTSSSGGRGGGRTVVLTSHSMEEVEALCGCAGIMAAGRLACVGRVQALKQRFGDGYTLEARLAPPAGGVCGGGDGEGASAGDEGGGGEGEFGARGAALLARVRAAWPGAALAEADAAGRRLLVRLPPLGAGGGGGGGGGGGALAGAFEALEAARGDLGVVDYGFRQSSLERVFLRVAGRQAAPGAG
ncbi:MAG: hypothetical protein J3K34DRAFT_522412 [Monoraphidium minutum]|nr:MAG: hypothetical protein J3K34DRAFT_522412 [Monoraphidium minutum]